MLQDMHKRRKRIPSRRGMAAGTVRTSSTGKYPRCKPQVRLLYRREIDQAWKPKIFGAAEFSTYLMFRQEQTGAMSQEGTGCYGARSR